MALAQNKRPSKRQSDKEIIEITSSDDNERPTKRARSTSAKAISVTKSTHYAQHQINQNKHFKTITRREHVEIITINSGDENDGDDGKHDDDDDEDGEDDEDVSKLLSIFTSGVRKSATQSEEPSRIRELSIRPSSKPGTQVTTDREVAHAQNEICSIRNPRSSRSPAKSERSQTPLWPKPVDAIRFDPEIKHPTPQSHHTLVRSYPDQEPDSFQNRNAARAPDGRSVRPIQIDIPKRAQNMYINRDSSQQMSSEMGPNRRPPIVNIPPRPSIREAREILTKMTESLDYFRKHAKELFPKVQIMPFEDTDEVKETMLKKASQKKRKTTKVGTSLDLLDPKSDPSPFLKDQETKSILKPRIQARMILTERFKKSEAAPILSFENRRNERMLDGKFQFVSEYFVSKKAYRAPQGQRTLRACTCKTCTLSCPCVNIMHETVAENGAKVSIAIAPYIREPDGRVCLSEEFLEEWAEDVTLIECGANCGCSEECFYRVAQKGRQVALQIFETRHCGFGVRTLQTIKRGQFIDLYLGEILTLSELDRREEAADEDTPAYVMSLDALTKDPKMALHVDGSRFGSVTRFVNHSCEPNCKTVPILLPGDTTAMYHVAFFATKDIAANTELTIDYDPKLEEMEDVDEELDESIVKCQCGSAKCRKRLWPAAKNRRKRRNQQGVKDDDD